MKKIFKMVIATVAVASIAGVSFAQATSNAACNATIIAPISISKTADMNFGNVAVSATTAGTVILAPAGSRTASGAGGVTLPSTSGTVSAASFTVSGAASFTYAITLPSSITISDGGSGSPHLMTVNSFTSSPSATGTIGSSGNQTLNVGATLNVNAGQRANVYTSASGVQVTVNYN